MRKTLVNLGKRLGDAAVMLGEKSCGKSCNILVHETVMPDILKKEMLKEQDRK